MNESELQSEFNATYECMKQYKNFSTQTDAVYCAAIFDSYLCWPPTIAGNNSEQNCPSVRLSDTSKLAYRTCGPSGHWMGLREEDTVGPGWTNYTPCFVHIPDLQKFFNDLYAGDSGSVNEKFEIAEKTRYLELVGFSISLASLVGSLAIFFTYRCLRNSRTKIHKNLFTAMLIQVMIRLVVYIDQGIARKDDDALNYYGINNMPYICQTFYILLEYANTAMFMWMFLEGYYLNMMVSATAAITDTFNYKCFFFVGWGSSVIFTTIWAVATTLAFGGETCWWGYNYIKLYWIVEGPRLAVVATNFIFLLNILRVLINKMKQTQTTEAVKLRKAAHAAVVLLPLLGITNVVNRCGDPLNKSYWEFAIWSFTGHFLTSFQGFFVSLIYCFLNGEVRAVLKKSLDDYLAMHANNGHRGSWFQILVGEMLPNQDYRSRLSQLINRMRRNDSNSTDLEEQQPNTGEANEVQADPQNKIQCDIE